MLGLDQFSFVAVWSPFAMAISFLVIVLYWLLLGRWRDRFSDSEPVSVRKKLSFTAGVLLFYFAQEGPLGLLGHLTFTGHMISMSISYLLVPPLLLYGLPAWLVRPILQDKAFQRFKSIFLRPVFTILFFNVIFSIYHMPIVHDFVMTNYVAHALYYLLLFIAATMMWWPIVCPVPEEDTLSDLKKMGYIFIAGMLLTPACALIIFAPESIYSTFNDPAVWAKAMAWCVPGGAAAVLDQYSGPELFSWMGAREDQQLGGVIMKLFQETMYGIILYYIFSNWYRKEKNEDDDEPEFNSEYNTEIREGQLNRA